MEQIYFLYHFMSTSVNEMFSLFLQTVCIMLSEFFLFIPIFHFSLLQYFSRIIASFLVLFSLRLTSFSLFHLLDSYQHDESSEPAACPFLYTARRRLR